MDQTNNQINQMQRKVLCLFYIVNCFILTRICSKSKSMARSQFDPRLCAALVQSKNLGRPPHHWPCDMNKVKIQNRNTSSPLTPWCEQIQNPKYEKWESRNISFDVRSKCFNIRQSRDVSHLSRHCLLLAWVSPFLQGFAEHLRKRSVGNHHRRLHVQSVQNTGCPKKSCWKNAAEATVHHCTMHLSPLKSCIKELWLNASLNPHFPSV